MTAFNEQELFNAVDATWPAYKTYSKCGWFFRQGLGGGKRVSAATLETFGADIVLAESEMRSMDQTPLFMIRQSDTALDQALDSLGYVIVDPVVLLGQACVDLSHNDPAFVIHNAPTPNQASLWAVGGVGPARLDVMARARGVSGCAAIEVDGETLATAFVSISNGIAMAHAVEVSEHHRRQGVGMRIMASIFDWASQNGARHLVVLTVRENKPAQSLYLNMGMQLIGAYHYRKTTKPR